MSSDVCIREKVELRKVKGTRAEDVTRSSVCGAL